MINARRKLKDLGASLTFAIFLHILHVRTSAHLLCILP